MFLEGVSEARIYAACAIALLYLASCAYFLRKGSRGGPAQAPEGAADATTVVAFASQTGFAEQLAMQTAHSLQSIGHSVAVHSLAALGIEQLSRASHALFIVSTTGEGDAPDTAAAFVRRTVSAERGLAHLRYAVLALGDREYKNFCAFGHRIDQWLRHQGAASLFDVVEVDNGDAGALRHWQHQLSVVTNSPDLPDWQAPQYERWQISARTLLNPRSAGASCFHIELRPVDAALPQWSAGDIVEIDPQNSTRTAPLAPLPHREYSIASIPEDGAIHLLVREMRRVDGRPGLGSGWLLSAELGTGIAARIRVNSNFHIPGDDRPLILIGNGTGIAGLRGLIKARIAAGHQRNWLIFGERSRANDSFYENDIEAWEREHWLERIDLVFSRDQAHKRYVQDRLAECAADVRSWIEQGAAIYVCGSLEGMAPAVDATLGNILGAEIKEKLAAEGRYRRDVY